MNAWVIRKDGVKVPVDKKDINGSVGFELIDLPPTIPRSRRSPLRLELSWLHNRLKEYDIKKVLEFSGGITTWTAYDATKPERFVTVEDKRFERIFNPVLDIYPDVEVVNFWKDIPQDTYDLVFVDGSSGKPSGFPDVARKEALEYSEQYHTEGTIVVFHDWGHPNRNGGWRAIKRYLNSSPKYEFIEAFKMGRKGFGMFRRV
jgi:hypothetical protein